MSQILGQTLGDRYRIVSLLGSGGMGEVYLAEHVVLGKRMAVKVLRADFSRDEEFVQRFQQEAVAASRIGHENIVNVTDFGRTPEGAFYFVMEALNGTDLASLVRAEGAVPLPRALPALIHVARALVAAHAQGIVHRDLKAENVMVVPRDDGTDLIKVLDFGISKMSSAADNPRVTRQGVVMGTPMYMAPEQARGDPTVDHRGDIYSFGVLAYELLTGSVPFTAPTPTALLLKHLSEAPEPPSKRRPDIKLPSELEALVMRMLEKEPDKRPQSMAQVRDVLMRTAQNLGVSSVVALTTPGRPPIALGAPLKANPSVSGQPALDRTWVSPRATARRKRRVLPTVLLMVAVALAGGGAVLGWQWSRQSSLPVPAAVAVAPTPPAVNPVNALHPPPSPAIATTTTVAPSPGPVDPPPLAPVVSPPVVHAALGPHRITVKDVERVFGRSSAKLRKCLQDNRGALPGHTGSIAVKFTVMKAGTVKSAEITTPGAASGALAHCVTARVEEMKFPAHAESAVAFEIPLAYDFQD